MATHPGLHHWQRGTTPRYQLLVLTCQHFSKTASIVAPHCGWAAQCRPELIPWTTRGCLWAPVLHTWHQFNTLVISMEQPEREKTRNSASAEPDLTPTAYRPAGRSPPRMTGQTIYRRAAGDRDVPRPSNAGKPINPFIHARAPAKPALAASQGAPPRPHATASTCPPPKPGILSRTASTGMAAAAPPPQGAAVGLKMNPTSGTAHLARKKSGALTAATVATGEGSNGSAVGGKGVQLPASPPASHLGSNRSNPVTPPALPGPSKKTGSPRPAVLGSDQQGFGPPAAVSNRRSAAHESGRSTSILTTKPATPASSAAVNALTSQTAAHSQGELLAQRVADSHSGRKVRLCLRTLAGEEEDSLLPLTVSRSSGGF